MNSLQKFVNELSLDQVVYICRDYESFERTGSTGDTALRQTTEAYLRSINTDTPTGLWMQYVAFECFRRLARGRY